MSPLPTTDEFEAKTIPVPMAGCWLWVGATDRHGYGIISRQGDDGKTKNVRAHRYAWSLYRGVIPSGLHVLHRCDTPPCVNPDHLFLGTHSDNFVDLWRKHGDRLRAERKARLQAA